MNYYSTRLLNDENLHILLKTLYEVKFNTIVNIIRKKKIKTFYLFKTKTIEYYLIKRLLYEVKSIFPTLKTKEIKNEIFIKNKETSFLIKEVSSTTDVGKRELFCRKKIYKEEILFNDVHIPTIKQLFCWVASINKIKIKKYNSLKLDSIITDKWAVRTLKELTITEVLIVPKENDDKGVTKFFERLHYLASNEIPFKLSYSEGNNEDYAKLKNKYLSAFLYINADYIL
jgi:hypothetical protein